MKGLAKAKPEGMAGISGPEMLWLADEASGIGDPMFEAIEGNRAGKARLVMSSNPTQTSGRFFRAFHTDAKFFKLFTLNAEVTPRQDGSRASTPRSRRGASGSGAARASPTRFASSGNFRCARRTRPSAMELPRGGQGAGARGDARGRGEVVQVGARARRGRRALWGRRLGHPAAPWGPGVHASL